MRLCDSEHVRITARVTVDPEGRLPPTEVPRTSMIGLPAVAGRRRWRGRWAAIGAALALASCGGQERTIMGTFAVVDGSLLEATEDGACEAALDGTVFDAATRVWVAGDPDSRSSRPPSGQAPSWRASAATSLSWSRSLTRSVVTASASDLRTPAWGSSLCTKIQLLSEAAGISK